MTDFLNPESNQGMLNKRSSPSFFNLDGERDSSIEVVEDKGSKFQKLLDKAELEDD